MQPHSRVRLACVCWSTLLLGCVTSPVVDTAADPPGGSERSLALAGFAFRDASSGGPIVVGQVYAPRLRLQPGDVIICMTTSSVTTCDSQSSHPVTSASLTALVEQAARVTDALQGVINLKIRRGGDEFWRSLVVGEPRGVVERPGRSQPPPQRRSAAADDGGPLFRVGEAIHIIKDNYVQPTQERALADHCIKALLAQRPPIGVRVEPATDDPLRDILAALRSVPPEHQEVAVESCLRGMVAETGRFSEYYDRADFRVLQVGSESPGGIGLELAADARGAKIVRPIEGAPAAAAGLLPGDLLTAVDGRDLGGRPLKEIVQLLRGPPGSSLAVTVQRPGRAEALHLSLKREVIRVPSIHSRLLEPGVLYLAPIQFREGTLEGFARAITGLRSQSQRPFTGVILDLRWCTGGLLYTAVGVAAAFLPPGVLVADLRGRGVDSTRSYRSDPRDYLRGTRDDPLARLPHELKSAPMVVLAGPATSAGAEIVASALQDHKRAVVMGTRSPGFGTVETIFPLGDNTGLKLTTARVYRPNGGLLDANGVVPEITVPAPTPVGGAAQPTASPPLGTRFGDLSDPAVVRALAFIGSNVLPQGAR